MWSIIDFHGTFLCVVEEPPAARLAQGHGGRRLGQAAVGRERRFGRRAIIGPESFSDNGG